MSIQFIPKVKVPAKAKKRLQVTKVGVRPKFAMFRDLGREKYLELENMFFSGETVNDVAKLITEKWGDMKDVAPNTLLMSLKRFKREIINPRLSRGVEIMRGKEKALSTAKVQLDVGLELYSLAKMQKDRMQKLYTQEQKMPMLLDSMSREIKLYESILSSISRFQVETGMMQRMKDGSPLVNVNILNHLQNYQAEKEVSAKVLSATGKIIDILSEPIESPE